MAAYRTDGKKVDHLIMGIKEVRVMVAQDTMLQIKIESLLKITLLNVLPYELTS